MSSSSGNSFSSRALFAKFLPEDEGRVSQSLQGVFRAKERTGKQRNVALKKIHFAEGEEGVPARALREISVLKSLDHPNIIQLLDVDYVPLSQSNSLYQVFEWIDCNLESVILNQGALPVDVAKQVLRQCLDALAYLHHRGIAHRNIRAENILIERASNMVKLSHFALAGSSSSSSSAWENIELERQHLWYAAPELLLLSEEHGCEVDLWAAGVVFAEMLTARHPLWPGQNLMEQCLLVFSALGSPQPRDWPEVVHLVGLRPEFLTFPPRSANTLLLHHEDLPVLCGLLELNPARRLSATAALELL